MLHLKQEGDMELDKDKKEIEKDNDAFNLFIDKLSLIIVDLVIDQLEGVNEQSILQIA